MLNDRAKRILGKFAFELKFTLGLADTSGIRDDEIMMNGRNLFPLYVGLYSDADKPCFRQLVRDGRILARCERLFRRYVYPRFYGGGFGGQAAVLNEGRVEAVAREVGEATLGPGRYGTVRGWLSDEPSRRLFDLEVLQQPLLAAGWDWGAASEAVCTGLLEKDFRRLMAEAKQKKLLGDFIGRTGGLAWFFSKTEIDFEAAALFLLDQYQYADICAVRPGDIFFDCGACYGDTAVWAMGKVGERGKVVAFEPLREQADLARENARRQASPRTGEVIVADCGVSDRSAEVRFDDAGTGSRQADQGRITAQLARIDDWCEEHGLYPDYVKMDIEGAELAALHGAEKTIRERRPRLAICVYHRPGEDLWQIPSFLKELVPSYRFYLKKSHFAVETVLFAVA